MAHQLVEVEEGERQIEPDRGMHVSLSSSYSKALPLPYSPSVKSNRSLHTAAVFAVGRIGQDPGLEIVVDLRAGILVDHILNRVVLDLHRCTVVEDRSRRYSRK